MVTYIQYAACMRPPTSEFFLRQLLRQMRHKTWDIPKALLLRKTSHFLNTETEIAEWTSCRNVGELVAIRSRSSRQVFTGVETCTWSASRVHQALARNGLVTILLMHEAHHPAGSFSVESKSRAPAAAVQHY